MFAQRIDERSYLKKSTRLLTITVELTNSTRLPDSVVKQGSLFQPLQWKRVSGTHGKGLLQLKPIYEMLSLSLLSYQTEETSISLKSKPHGCMENLTELEYEHVFRNFLMNFTKRGDEICNEHIRNISGYIDFFHVCCHTYQQAIVSCEHVFINKWMKAIHYCIYIVIGIVLLYCPLLIPSSLYDPNFGPKQFAYHLKDPVTITVKKTNENVWKNKCRRLLSHSDTASRDVPYAIYADMTNFKEELNKYEDNQVYNVQLSKIYFNVPIDEVVVANEVPTSLLHVLYELFLKCGLRNQEGFSACCTASMCGHCSPKWISYEWYKFLRFILRVVLSVVICLPWILRVCVFYFYENEIRETRHKAAETRNLLMHIENNYAYYGTPVHIAFIFSYALMVIGYIVLEVTSVVLFKNAKCLVRGMLTNFFLGLCSQSKQKIFRWSVKVLLKPFKIFGFFGILFAVPYWVLAVPLISIVSAYYFFPTVYIAVNFVFLFLNIFRTCKLKSDDFWHGLSIINHYCKCSFDDIWNEQDISMQRNQNAIIHLRSVTRHKPLLSPIKIFFMFILLCLMLSSLLLAVELILFFIKVAIYTIVGLIVNSSHAMQYISTISLAWLYYRRCFCGIGQIYKAYNKAVQTIMYRVIKRKVDEIAMQDISEQENTAFHIIGERSQRQRGDMPDGPNDLDENRKVHVHGGIPKFNSNGVFLLLDKFDKQYLTKKFFFKVCRIEPGAPGPWSKHFLKALWQFSIIFIFLTFVMLVVLAFGDSYSVSFPNQLLATLAGGVVPWILMKTNLLFSQADIPDKDEVVARYFNDRQDNSGLTNNETSLKVVQLEQPEQRLNENGEVVAKGIFKKKFNEKIEKHNEWWTIGDMDVVSVTLVNTEDSEVDLLLYVNGETINAQRGMMVKISE